mgnify:CR=1 FL=1
MSHLKCSDKPMEELRFAVLKKYGKLYGFLSKEINNALSEHAIKIEKELKKSKEVYHVS